MILLPRDSNQVAILVFLVATPSRSAGTRWPVEQRIAKFLRVRRQLKHTPARAEQTFSETDVFCGRLAASAVAVGNRKAVLVAIRGDTEDCLDKVLTRPKFSRISE